MTPLKNNLAQTNWWIVLILFIVVSVVVVVVVKNMEKTKHEEELLENNFPAIRITVLNGCGFAGVANNVRSALSEKNIDVINTSNARKFIYDETLIIVKHDDAEDLQRLIRMTGIKNVIYAINEQFNVPFIIVAGKDYQRYFGT